jgi:hypothetical protein
VVGDLFETVPAFIAGLRSEADPLLANVPKKDVTTAV